MMAMDGSHDFEEFDIVDTMLCSCAVVPVCRTERWGPMNADALYVLFGI